MNVLVSTLQKRRALEREKRDENLVGQPKSDPPALSNAIAREKQRKEERKEFRKLKRSLER